MRYVYTFEEGVLIFTSYNLTTGESFTTRNKYSLSGNKLTVTDEFGESQTVDIYYGEDYLYIDVGLVNRIWQAMCAQRVSLLAIDTINWNVAQSV